MPPSTPTSRSTRGNPSRTVHWLFFNPRNADSVVRTIEVPGYPEDLVVEKLEWTAALKAGFKFQADWATVRFWRPEPPLLVNKVDRGWIRTVVDVADVSCYCQPAFLVDGLFDGSRDAKHVHIFVTAEELVQDGGPEGAEEETDIVPPLDAMHRRFTDGVALFPVPPSRAATSKERAKLQNNQKTVIYDGYHVHQPGTTIAPPLQIFHPVFQEFLNRIENQTFEPDEDTVSTVSDLMLASTSIYSSEDGSLAQLRQLLSKLLGGFLGQTSSTRTRTPDGIRFKDFGDGTIAPLVCFEYKRAFGEGGCDPSIQASYSVRNFVVSPPSKEILGKCCCPAFLLAGGGPYLSVLGVVYTDRFIVQRLTDVMWVGEATTYEDARVHSLARVFTSLRLAVTALDGYYDQVWGSNIPAYTTPPHPRLFPYPTKFKAFRAPDNLGSECTEFEYIDTFSADPANVTFLAKVKLSNQKLVIKFVDRYGAEAHELLAREGLAPRLLYCGLLDGTQDSRTADGHSQGSANAFGLHVGPTRMVVMDFIEGKTVEKMSPVPSDAREKTLEAIKKLHDAQFVFGDLRAPNVVISSGKVFLIDFDWAGRVGQARYPRNLSRSVKWPARAEELEMKPILMDHDLTMLDKLFPKQPPTDN